MSLGQYQGTCKSCASAYDNEARKIPCIQAHRDSAKHGNAPVMWMMNGNEVGGNGACAFLCTWDEVVDFALHPGKFRPNDELRNWMNEVRRKFQGFSTPHDARNGQATPGEPVHKGLYEEYNGRMMSGGWGVILRASAGSQKWRDFERFFLQNCCADISSLGGFIKFQWALQESIPFLRPEMIEATSDIANNMGMTVATMGAFAVAAAIPPLAPLALIAGVGMDCKFIYDASDSLGKFFSLVKNAERISEITDAGKLWAKFCDDMLCAALLAGVLAGAGVLARKVGKGIKEWFVKKKSEWDRAQAPATTAVHEPSSGSSAPSAKGVYHGESSRSRYNRYLADARAKESEAAAASKRDDRAAWEKAMDEAQALKEQARLTRAFHEETVGHIQAVNKLSRIFLNKYLRNLKQLDTMQRVERLVAITAEFSKKPGFAQFKMTHQEAYAVAADIDVLSADINFEPHDSTGAANKFLASINEGLKQNQAPWSVWLRNQYNDAWKQYRDPDKLGPARKTKEQNEKRGIPPEQYVQQQIDKLPPEKRKAMEQVDAARLAHGADNAHHNPKSPVDFFEYGCDVICAMVQDRCYRAGRLLTSLGFGLQNGELFGVGRRSHNDTTTVPRAAGWLKMMSMVMAETGETGYFKSPQTGVKARGINW